MRRRRASSAEDTWLEERLKRSAGDLRAPRGFSARVMDAVYREAMTAGRSEVPGPASQPMRRLYRRVALSFMLTAAVLAGSLLLPRVSYPRLIQPASTGAALGPGPSAAVREALADAAVTVQGALGERLIGGSEQ
ncbi:MAG TPA: hypothetical protein VFI08_07625 [Spirochaetia bacterium]|nr:hypothetical protein [Spirochaetia bacterium]